MDLNHHLFLLTLNGALHLAPIPTSPNRILDIGTGTGIWAIEMGDQYPSASIIGNDLSPIQPSFVPSNVSHEKLNEKQLARENPGFWSFIDKSAPGPIRNR